LGGTFTAWAATTFNSFPVAAITDGAIRVRVQPLSFNSFPVAAEEVVVDAATYNVVQTFNSFPVAASAERTFWAVPAGSAENFQFFPSCCHN